MVLKEKTGKFSFTLLFFQYIIQGHAISPTWPSPTSLSLSRSFPDGNHGWHHHDHDPPGTRWWLLTVYPCPSVSRFPGQLATLWPGYNPHDGDALVRNSNESLQASPRASVSPEASDWVSPGGKKGSKEGLYHHEMTVTTARNLLRNFIFWFFKVCAPAPVLAHPHRAHHTKPVHGK